MAFSGFKAEMSELYKKGHVTVIDDPGQGHIMKALESADMAHWDTRRLPIRGVLRFALEQLLDGAVKFGNTQKWWDLFEIRGDDRARVVQSVVLSGQTPSKESPAEAAFGPWSAHYCGVDSFGFGFPYDTNFSKNETSKMPIMGDTKNGELITTAWIIILLLLDLEPSR